MKCDYTTHLFSKTDSKQKWVPKSTKLASTKYFTRVFLRCHWWLLPFKFQNATTVRYCCRLRTSPQPSSFPFITLQPKLGSPPVPTLGIVPDGVISSHANPMWYWAILFHLFCQLDLDPESPLRRLQDHKFAQTTLIIWKQKGTKTWTELLWLLTLHNLQEIQYSVCSIYRTTWNWICVQYHMHIMLQISQKTVKIKDLFPLCMRTHQLVITLE